MKARTWHQNEDSNLDRLRQIERMTASLSSSEISDDEMSDSVYSQITKEYSTDDSPKRNKCEEEITIKTATF